MASVLKTKKITAFTGKHGHMFVRGKLKSVEFLLDGLQSFSGFGETAETETMKVNGNPIGQTDPNIDAKEGTLTMFEWTWEAMQDFFNYDNMISGLERFDLVWSKRHPRTGECTGFIAIDCQITDRGDDDDLNAPTATIRTITVKPTSFVRLGTAKSEQDLIRVAAQAALSVL